jgi:hypothetical protein
MATQSATLDDIREMFRESDRKFHEQNAEFDRRMKIANKRISELGSKIGKIVEHMIRGNVVEQFQALGYDVSSFGRNYSFSNKKLNIRGEIDLFLGDIFFGTDNDAVFIEVKTTLEMYDVRKHLERLEKFRHYANVRRSEVMTKRFVGAVAGAVVADNVVDFAHENGLYAIVQSGKAFVIAPQPDGFKAQEW